jgi:hypothetical protein
MFPNGATSISLCADVYDPNGDPNTAINVADYDVYYLEQGAAWGTKIDANALTAATDAWYSGKAYDLGRGTVRFDIPNRCLDGGIGKWVEIRLYDQTGASDDGSKDKIEPIKIQLGGAVDVRYMAGSASPITNQVLVWSTDFTDAYNATAKRMRADTDYWDANAVPDSNDPGRPSVIVRRGDNGSDISDVTLLPYTPHMEDTGDFHIVQSDVEAALTTQGYTAVIAAQLDYLYAALLQDTQMTITDVNDKKTFVVADGNGTDNFYRGLAVVTHVADSNRRAAAFVRHYDGAGKQFILDSNLPFLPDVNDTVYILTNRRSGR